MVNSEMVIMVKVVPQVMEEHPNCAKVDHLRIETRGFEAPPF